MSGIAGSDRKPCAVMTASAVSVPAEVSSSQCRASSSQRAELTVVSKRTRGQHAVVLGDLAQVAVDLRLLGVGVGPVRVEREGERVEVRRDVAAAAGVLVGPPGAADVVHLLDDDVLDALLGAA